MQSTFHNEEQTKAEIATINFPAVKAPKISPKRRPGCRLQSTNLRKIAALAGNHAHTGLHSGCKDGFVSSVRLSF